MGNSTVRVKANKQSILIVEDDERQLRRYVEMARSAGLRSLGAVSQGAAMTILAGESFQFVLTDIHLNGQNRQDTFEGLTLLRSLHESMPEVIPLAMTSDPTIETYESVMAVGVAHLFRKPIANKDELLIHLDAAQRRRMVGTGSGATAGNHAWPKDLLARCPDGVVLPEHSRALLRKFTVGGKAPIVIHGETGTGKEEVAKLVHRWRCELEGPVPLVAINCANLTGDTVVSTLFGHKKGAFTGADGSATGCIGAANGGILFLDEIHTLSLECQQRLLRVLNDGTYSRLGETQVLHSDFQVLVATTRDLDDEVEKGSFLQDLRSRLTGLDFKLAPLRERHEDLPLLVEIGLARQGITLPPDELERLVQRCKQFYWQANIRQLFQVLQSLVLLSENDATEVRAEDLPIFKTMLPPKGVAYTPLGGAKPLILGRFDDLMRQHEAELILNLLTQAAEADAAIISSQRKAAAYLGMSRHGFTSVMRRTAQVRPVPSQFAHLLAD